MRMSDIVGSMDMTIFPIVGLVIFLGVFVAVVARAVMASSTDARRAAGIPLDDESTTTPTVRR